MSEDDVETHLMPTLDQQHLDRKTAEEILSRTRDQDQKFVIVYPSEVGLLRRMAEGFLRA